MLKKLGEARHCEHIVMSQVSGERTGSCCVIRNIQDAQKHVMRMRASLRRCNIAQLEVCLIRIKIVVKVVKAYLWITEVHGVCVRTVNGS